MTPDQTKLIDLITARGLTEQATLAVAGDATAMAAVLADLQNYSVTAEPRLCYAVESGEAATAAGGDHTTLLAVLLGDPNGIMLFQKLSSSAGVMWSHPVTLPYLDWLVSQEKMTTEVRDALVQLSAPTTYPQAEVTAEQVSIAWIIKSTIDPIRTAQAAAGTRLNNAIASLAPEHIYGLTLEQLQARCDAVAASADGLVGE